MGKEVKKFVDSKAEVFAVSFFFNFQLQLEAGETNKPNINYIYEMLMHWLGMGSGCTASTLGIQQSWPRQSMPKFESMVIKQVNEQVTKV